MKKFSREYLKRSKKSCDSMQERPSVRHITVKQGILDISDLKTFLSVYGKNAVFINADYIVGEDHAYFSAKKAIEAWNEGRAVARSLPLEVMLYAAATRQINEALKIGVREGRNRTVAIFLEGNVEVEGFREANVLKMSKEKIDRIVNFFKINKNELEVAGVEKLPLIVRERIVLFDLNK